jgi:CheY-like chemotaxis protein
MGGEVGVDSEPGKGSCFWATVRLRRSGGSQPVLSAVDGESARDVLARDHRGKRILVVEDEPSNREVAASLLLDAGLVPELAVDGRGALDRARTGKFSMILMDLQMPVMNGLDAAQEIRRLPGMQRIPIVAMTANAFDADRQRCIDAGMNDHLRKPVLPEELYDRVLHWLSVPEAAPSGQADASARR